MDTRRFRVTLADGRGRRVAPCRCGPLALRLHGRCLPEGRRPIVGVSVFPPADGVNGGVNGGALPIPPCTPASAPAPAPPPFAIPTYALAGGGTMPAMMMGGDDYAQWFAATAPGRGIQTFYSYGNGPRIAPQLRQAGREQGRWLLVNIQSPTEFASQQPFCTSNRLIDTFLQCQAIDADFVTLDTSDACLRPTAYRCSLCDRQLAMGIVMAGSQRHCHPRLPIGRVPGEAGVGVPGIGVVTPRAKVETGTLSRGPPSGSSSFEK